MKPTKSATEEITVITVGTELLHYNVLGTTPLILNAMSAKVRQQLLLPPAKKNAAERKTTLKHNPIEEYRASAYKSTTDDSATRILMPTLCFKGSLRSAALDIPGATKSQIGRLAFVEGVYVSIYGVPQLLMSVTRNSDPARTPDIRTRAILPEWACTISVRIMVPMLNSTAVSNLLAAAGVMRGVGDWRAEKGSGNFGQFALVEKNDKAFNRVVKGGGLRAQDAAFESPEFFDAETSELFSWFEAEVERRGFTTGAMDEEDDETAEVTA